MRKALPTIPSLVSALVIAVFSGSAFPAWGANGKVKEVYPPANTGKNPKVGTIEEIDESRFGLGRPYFVFRIPSGLADPNDIPAVGDVVVFEKGKGQTARSVKSITEYVFVANAASDSVTVYDSATDKLLEVIPVADHPRYLAPHGLGLAYVSCQNTDEVQLLDPSKGSVLTSISVGGRPQGLALSPGGLQLLVCNLDDDTVSVVNTVLQTVDATVPVEDRPVRATWSPDGSTWYIAHSSGFGSGVVTAYDAATGVELQKLFIGGRPRGIEVSPDGDRLFVTNGQLDVIDITATPWTSTRVSIGRGSFDCELTSDGTLLYAATRAGVWVVETDPAGGFSVVASITEPGGKVPVGVAVLDDGTKAYSSQFAGGKVDVIDAMTQTHLQTMRGGRGGFDVETVLGF